MKNVCCVFVTICFLMIGSAELSAQTRRRTTTKRRAAQSTRIAPTNATLGAARVSVAEQIKLLARFLYLFGRISSGIEMADEQARQSQSRPEAAQLSQRSKAALAENLKNVREGLDRLEIRFRTTPELERYYSRMMGVATSAANAEELAAANRLDQAGRTLLDVVNRLTEVLLEIQ